MDSQIETNYRIVECPGVKVESKPMRLRYQRYNCSAKSDDVTEVDYKYTTGNPDKSVQVSFEIGHKASVKKQKTVEGFTHDWVVYVRGGMGCDPKHFIDRVEFTLHPSFPNHKRVVREAPYHVIESGYGGFMVTIDIFWRQGGGGGGPRKVRYSYELYLPLKGSVDKFRREVVTFQNPSVCFMASLLQGGAVFCSTDEDKSCMEIFDHPIIQSNHMPTNTLTVETQPKFTGAQLSSSVGKVVPGVSSSCQGRKMGRKPGGGKGGKRAKVEEWERCESEDKENRESNIPVGSHNQFTSPTIKQSADCRLTVRISGLALPSCPPQQQDQLVQQTTKLQPKDKQHEQRKQHEVQENDDYVWQLVAKPQQQQQQKQQHQQQQNSLTTSQQQSNTNSLHYSALSFNNCENSVRSSSTNSTERQTMTSNTNSLRGILKKPATQICSAEEPSDKLENQFTKPVTKPVKPVQTRHRRGRPRKQNNDVTTQKAVVMITKLTNAEVKKAESRVGIESRWRSQDLPLFPPQGAQDDVQSVICLDDVMERSEIIPYTQHEKTNLLQKTSCQEKPTCKNLEKPDCVIPVSSVQVVEKSVTVEAAERCLEVVSRGANLAEGKQGDINFDDVVEVEQRFESEMNWKNLGLNAEPLVCSTPYKHGEVPRRKPKIRFCPRVLEFSVYDHPEDEEMARAALARYAASEALRGNQGAEALRGNQASETLRGHQGAEALREDQAARVDDIEVPRGSMSASKAPEGNSFGTFLCRTNPSNASSRSNSRGLEILNGLLKRKEMENELRSEISKSVEPSICKVAPLIPESELKSSFVDEQPAQQPTATIVIKSPVSNNNARTMIQSSNHEATKTIIIKPIVNQNNSIAVNTSGRQNVPLRNIPENEVRSRDTEIRNFLSQGNNFHSPLSTSVIKRTNFATSTPISRNLPNGKTSRLRADDKENFFPSPVSGLVVSRSKLVQMNPLPVVKNIEKVPEKQNRENEVKKSNSFTVNSSSASVNSIVPVRIVVEQVKRLDTIPRAANGERMSILLEVQKRLAQISDTNVLKKIFKIIEESGNYKVNNETFDFELCSLDRETIRKIYKCMGLNRQALLQSTA